MFPAGALSPGGSVIWGNVVVPLLVLLAIQFPLIAWWRDRRRARAAERADAGQADGGVAVVKGRVATDGQGPAITLEIEQRGWQRSNKNGYFVQWAEVGRKVTAKPFWVEQADGRRVRVEPDERVFLVDKLETAARGRAARARIATLTDGEPVHVIGVLQPGLDPMGGYREASAKVLRPERGRRMLISTEPLADRHRRRARFHARWTLLGGGLLVAVYLLCFGKYLALETHGRTYAARVERLHTYVTTTKGSRTMHYEVDATLTDENGLPHRVWDEVSHRDWVLLRTGETVPFRAWSPTGWSQIGASATAPFGGVVGLVLALALLGLLYPVNSRATSPWYDRPRLVETTRGRL